jgi:hypothetical protein
MTGRDEPIPSESQRALYWRRYRRTVILAPGIIIAAVVVGILLAMYIANAALRNGLLFLTIFALPLLELPVNLAFRCPVCDCEFAALLSRSAPFHTRGRCENCGAKF